MSDQNLPYQQGTIKLTWISPEDYRILNSQMFNSVEEALNNLPSESLGNNWLLFELRQTDGNQYAWKVLPYGKHKGYVTGMKFRDNPVLHYGSYFLMIVGVISLVKSLHKLSKNG